MEYYGKILCISYNDLTYDDRPVMVNGKADYSRSRTLKGVHPSTLSEEELAPIMSIPNYKKLAAKEKINVVRSGRGLGGYVLVEIATMPLRFQERIKLKYGDMKEDVIRNWLGSHYHIDAKAREFYTRFRFDNGDALPPEHIQEYTVNASVIEAVMRAMEDATFMRKAMKAGPVNWGAEIQAVKDARDKELRDVFTGKSDKFLAIIGPCSADNEDAVLDYLTRLRNVQEKIADKVLIVPRVYTNKPRTTGEGYKGMVHQPDPEKQPNLLAGLVAIRKMHIHAIRTSGMTCADEMLYPENYRYLSDLLSYVAVGARSVEDQQHRLTVSGMEVPAGMKNPTSGDLAVMLNSVVAAQGGHRFIYRSWEVETTGNELAHTILRGAVNKHGEAIPNYHYEDLRLLWEKYQEKNLKNPAVIVDTNHSNSNKQYDQQVRIAKEVLHSRQVDPELHTLVKGLMIESYIEPGNQKIGCDHIYGKSITDPCLGWEESERLLYTIAEMC